MHRICIRVWGTYRDRYLCFLLRAFPYLYESYCKTQHVEDETRNFDKRKSIIELQFYLNKLSGMQVDSIAL